MVGGAMKLTYLSLIAVGTIIPSAFPLNAQEAPQPKQPMLEAPEDVAAPPDDAKVTDSGLASKILKAADGDNKPTAEDTVKVHYTGWTKDGKMFDSSVTRGEPTQFPLNGVIAGWTEGVQLMNVGEKRRFWIPAELAYGENPAGGRPGGMLVFDIELLEIIKPATVPEDAKKSESGIAYEIITAGEGDATPEATDIATFHFTGKTMQGQAVQDTKRQPTAPVAPLDQLPPEFAEILGDMKAGEIRRAWLAEPQMPGGFLVADFQLISFKKPEPAPPVPENVAAAPDDAKKTESGIASIVLETAKDDDKPKAEDTVKVHYTGWTTDGKMFDSSVTRGEPTQFPLNRVIPGWTEGLQLMNVGEKRRFWIPAALAYGEEPPEGAPAGTLVFDIELLEIVR